MKRRRLNVIELTPLLDVIMIILFMVLSHSSATVTAAQQESTELRGELQTAGAENDELRTELAIAQSRLDGAQGYNENSAAAAVSIVRHEGEKRTITVCEGEKVREISFDWDSLGYAESALSSELSRFCRENEGKAVFISFTYDSAEIFRRDYEIISAVLSKAGGDSESIYITFSDTNERN